MQDSRMARVPHCHVLIISNSLPEAVEKIKKLPVALTVQPGFSWLDKRYLKSYEQFLPKEKAEQQIPLKELAGGRCASADPAILRYSP